MYYNVLHFLKMQKLKNYRNAVKGGKKAKNHYQLMGLMDCCSNSSFVFEKCLHPKNPL